MSIPLKSIERKKFFLVLFLLISTIVAAYASSLHGTWALDDVVANKPVGIRDIQDILGFRKVAAVTFLLHQTFLPPTPLSYRFVNILIHAINSVLVFVLSYVTIGLHLRYVGNEGCSPRFPKSTALPETVADRAFSVALMSSFLFGLHPININAVAYIVQRMAALAALFSLLSLLAYVYATLANNKPKATLLYVLSGVFLVAGIFSKENAIVTVPLILLYDYIFLSQQSSAAFKKRVIGIGIIGIVSIVFVSYFLKLHETFVDIVFFWLHPHNPLPERGWMAVDVYWTPLQHLLTEFRVVSRYLMLLFVPIPSLLVFDWWGFPVSMGLTMPITTLLSAVFIIILILFAILALRRFPLLCFGILWYFIAISLESFMAVGADLYFEHRNYLPVSGLFVGFVGQGMLFFAHRVSRRKIRVVAFAIVLILGTLTFVRNGVWKDSVTLWSDTAKKAPENVRAVLSLGNAYMAIPDFEMAKKQYVSAVKMSVEGERATFFRDAVYRLGLAYLFEKNLVAARSLIEKADTLTNAYQIQILKGFYAVSIGDIDGAIRIYREILPYARRADRVVVFTLLGDAFREKGLWDDAIMHYQRALSEDLSFSASYYGIGVSFMGKGEPRRAQEYFSKALSVDPNNILALADMADLKLIQHQVRDAEAYARTAIAKSPPFYQPYLTMANVLLVLGREEEAERYYRESLERRAPEYLISFSKARSYYLKGDLDRTRHYIAELKRFGDLPEKYKRLVQQVH